MNEYCFYLNKVIKQKIDETVRWRFYRYGKGEHKGPKLKINVTEKRINVKASFMYENLIEWIYIQLTRKEKHKIKGNIESYFNLEELLPETKLTKKIRKTAQKQILKIDDEITLTQLKTLFSKVAPFSYMFLSLQPVEKGEIEKVKTKKKFPKPEKLLEPELSFTSATFPYSQENLVFITELVAPDFTTPKIFKEFMIENEFNILEFIPPEKGEVTRKTVKRKTEIKRKLTVDKYTKERKVSVVI